MPGAFPGAAVEADKDALVALETSPPAPILPLLPLGEVTNAFDDMEAESGMAPAADVLPVVSPLGVPPSRFPPRDDEGGSGGVADADDMPSEYETPLERLHARREYSATSLIPASKSSSSLSMMASRLRRIRISVPNRARVIKI